MPSPDLGRQELCFIMKTDNSKVESQFIFTFLIFKLYCPCHCFPHCLFKSLSLESPLFQAHHLPLDDIPSLTFPSSLGSTSHVPKEAGLPGVSGNLMLTHIHPIATINPGISPWGPSHPTLIWALDQIYQISRRQNCEREALINSRPSPPSNAIGNEI